MRRDNFDLHRFLRDVQRLLIKGCILGFVDGSFNVKNTLGGYGVFIQNGMMEKNISVGPFFNSSIDLMELMAILEALRNVDKKDVLYIYSDSQRAINLSMGWVAIKSSEYVDIIDNIKAELVLFNVKPKIKWIPAHLDIVGSREADRLAEEGRKIWRYSKRNG